MEYTRRVCVYYNPHGMTAFYDITSPVSTILICQRPAAMRIPGPFSWNIVRRFWGQSAEMEINALVADLHFFSEAVISYKRYK